jgi:hypothetical protein
MDRFCAMVRILTSVKGEEVGPNSIWTLAFKKVALKYSRPLSKDDAAVWTYYGGL